MKKGGPGSGKKEHKTNKEGGAFLREDTSKDEEKKETGSSLAQIYAKYGMSGADIAFMTDLAGSKTYEVNKSEIDNEIDRIAKAMEYTTIEPVSGIKRAIFELGPEGLKKAMETMTGENKELLGDILEEMNKSHKLPLDPPKKLVNVGGENYVEEQVGDDLADEAIFEEAVKEGDNEHKHQGGAHDMEPKDWQGQIIKSILTLDDHEEVLEGLETIYDAWEMKKAKKMEKNMYKGEEDDTVAEDVKEIQGKKTVKDVMEEAAPSKKDNILAELRETKMKKARELIKAAMKKECEGMDEGKAELMKNKMRKALVEVLSEEYTDQEIEKAMKKGEEEGGPKEIDIKIEAPSEDKKEEPKEEKPVVVAEEASEEKPEMEAKPDMEKKMKKAMELFAKSKELLDMGEKDLARGIFLKARDMMAVDIPEAKQVDQSKSEVGMNMGKGKGKIHDPALKPETTADAVKSPKMAKSIKWYGEENDAFKAGRLGRHSYASSVNEYYDDMIAKSEAPVQEEEPMKKSINTNDINDLIENEIMWSATDIKDYEGFKKSDSQMGNYTMSSFDDADMLKSLNISEEEASEVLGKSEYLAKAKFIRKIGSGSNARYVYKMPDGSTKVSGGKIASAHPKEGGKVGSLTAMDKKDFAGKAVKILQENRGKWVSNRDLDKKFSAKHPDHAAVLSAAAAGKAKGVLPLGTWNAMQDTVKADKWLESKKQGNTRLFRMRSPEEGPRPNEKGLVVGGGGKAPPAGSPQAILQGLKKR